MACCNQTRFISNPPIDNDDIVIARIGELNTKDGLVNSDASVGDYVRLQIRREGIIIYTSQAVSNNGNNFGLSYGSTELMNGDEICIQACNDSNWNGNTDEDCRVIPTPRFTFVAPSPIAPAQCMRWDEKEIITPSCLAGDLIDIQIRLVDAQGESGFITATGKLVSFNDGTDEDNYIPLDGNDGTGTINTNFGQIQYSAVYTDAFRMEQNKTVSMHVIDCNGWKSIEPHRGITNAIITELGEPIVNEDSGVIFFAV